MVLRIQINSYETVLLRHFCYVLLVTVTSRCHASDSERLWLQAAVGDQTTSSSDWLTCHRRIQHRWLATMKSVADTRVPSGTVRRSPWGALTPTYRQPDTSSYSFRRRTAWTSASWTSAPKVHKSEEAVFMPYIHQRKNMFGKSINMWQCYYAHSGLY